MQLIIWWPSYFICMHWCLEPFIIGLGFLFSFGVAMLVTKSMTSQSLRHNTKLYLWACCTSEDLMKTKVNILNAGRGVSLSTFISMSFASCNTLPKFSRHYSLPSPAWIITFIPFKNWVAMFIWSNKSD